MRELLGIQERTQKILMEKVKRQLSQHQVTHPAAHDCEVRSRLILIVANQQHREMLGGQVYGNIRVSL